MDTGKRIEVSGYSKGQLVAMLESAYADTPEVEEIKVPRHRRRYQPEKPLDRVQPLSPSQEEFMRDLVYTQED